MSQLEAMAGIAADLYTQLNAAHDELVAVHEQLGALRVELAAEQAKNTPEEPPA